MSKASVPKAKNNLSKIEVADELGTPFSNKNGNSTARQSNSQSGKEVKDWLKDIK